MRVPKGYGLAIALTCIGSSHHASAQQSTLPEVEIQQQQKKQKQSIAAPAKPKTKAPQQAPAVQDAPPAQATSSPPPTVSP